MYEPLPPKGPSPLRIAASVALAGAAIVWACTTEVTVPLVWPAGSTLLTAGLLYERARRRRRRDTSIHPSLSPPYAEAGPAPMTVEDALTGPTGQRIGTTERHIVLDRLAERYGSGHLDDAELEQRQRQALQAVTREALAHLLRDLP